MKCGHLAEMDGHLQRGWGRKAKLYAWCEECDCERLITRPGISVWEAHRVKRTGEAVGKQEALF